VTVDTIGNRNRDLPACSAVSQPTAPPRAPELLRLSLNKSCLNHSEGLYVVCLSLVSATDQSVVRRSPTECGVSECDLENSTMNPRPTMGCQVVRKLNKS
jgi:hypothetical protein